jgi:zinc/manganese transport system ATP-binding protein
MSGGMRPVVEFHDVAVHRGGHTVWSHGTFGLPAGGVTAVIGPNGSGKTTLLELLLGLREPSEGTLTVLGQAPRRGNPRIGYVPQHYTDAIGGVLRCRDLVTLGRTGTRWGAGWANANDRAHVAAALAAVGATEFANRRLTEVSGGQQQRVAIAQALVSEPDLLLLDEPLANLDVRAQYEITDLLDSLVAGGLTVVVVTHDLNPLLGVLTGAVYLLDGHAHYAEVGEVADDELLSHLYGTSVQVVRTAQGDLFTRRRGTGSPQ